MKILFFDLDGTIFWDGKVSESVVSAIKTVQAAGNLAIVNTGRSFGFTPGAVKRCLDWDGFICGTGHVTLGQKTLCDRVFTRETVCAIYDYCEQKGYSGHFEGETVMYVSCPTEETERVFERRSRAENDITWVKITREYIDRLYDDMRITKVAVIGHIEPDEAARFPGVYSLDFGNAAEIYCNGFTKATGMELIGRYLGIGRGDMIAFGDSLNDIDMIEYAGAGAVMEHAPEQLLSRASVTMPSGPDGVALCLRALFPELF